MKRLPFAAALLTLGLAGTAHSLVVSFTAQNVPIPLTFGGVYLNLLDGSASASQPGSWNTAPWINPFFGGVDLANDELIHLQITGADQILNLPAGTVVDGSATYTVGESGSATHFGPAANQFHAGTPGYLGFSIQPTAGGPSYYGWAKVTFNNAGAGTIHEWAYENTPGNSIAAGAVPEPGMAGALLLGAFGMAAQRRRRR